MVKKRGDMTTEEKDHANLLVEIFHLWNWCCDDVDKRIF